MASSLIYDGVIILQPFTEQDRKIRLDLGYPSGAVFEGHDPREDARIKDALEVSGKLK